MKMKIQMFASTNTTTNYGLSQYVGSDKPTYLGDYNSDMYKIDTQMKANADASGVNATAIGDLTNLTTTAKSDLVNAVNEVAGGVSTNAGAISSTNTNIGTLANLDTSNKTSIVNAINELVSSIGLFNLTSYSAASASLDYGTITSNNCSIAANSDGSLAKIYGVLQIGSIQGSAERTLTITSDLRPDTEFTISSAGIVTVQNTSDIRDTFPLDIKIKTNGDIEAKFRTYSNTNYVTIQLFPCLYWIKDFGDSPTPPQV